MSRTTNITMVHAAKIASLGYPGCKTVQGVASFCRKNKKSVNCVWWKSNNKNILFVDPNSFKQCYKTIAAANKTSGGNTKWTSHRTGTTTKIRTKRTWRKGTRRITRRRAA